MPSSWHVGDVVEAGCRYDRPPFASLRLLALEPVDVDELDELDAAREDVGNVAALRELVRELYPSATSLIRVRFELMGDSRVSATASSSSSGSPR